MLLRGPWGVMGANLSFKSGVRSVKLPTFVRSHVNVSRCGLGTLGGWSGAGMGVGISRGKFFNVFETYFVNFI